MRIIGSICYAHIPVQKRIKMDKKATKGYLGGYVGGERCRIYINETRTVICSRHVIFEQKPSTSENVITLPFQQATGRNQYYNDENEAIVDEDLQLEEVKVIDFQQKESRPRRQISTSKWTKIISWKTQK